MSPISLFRQSDPYEQLIAQMIAIESRPQQALKDQQAKQDRLKSVMKDVDSKLSALHTLVKSFTDLFSSPFDARKAELADHSYFGVSASKDAAFGTHSLDVQRLATTDKRVSRQHQSTGTDLRQWFDSNGTQAFAIEVGHPTEGDPSHRVSVSVTVTPTGATDEEILKEIATAINDAMEQAVVDGTITREEKAHSSVVNESTGTARLTLGSGTTGFAHRLGFGDSAGSLLQEIELNNAIVAEGTGGGMVTDIGTSETDSALNSMFVLNGLTMYRSTNSVADALQGTTLSLKQAGGGSQDFTIVADKDAVKKEVENFIAKYNDVLIYIQSKSTVDGEADVRGDLAGDSTFRGLRFELRNDVALQVGGQPADGPTSITDLGITIEKDGTLKLSDADKLVAAVQSDAGAVESLFSGADGIAARLKSRIDRFVGVKGIINGRIDSIDSNIKRIKNRISSWDDRLLRREDQLRMQFARLQESMATLQGQQQSMMMFFGGFA